MELIDNPPADVDAIRTYRAWWPAAALLPDKTVWHRVRVYATTVGLLIYRAVPTPGGTGWGALTPDWASPIDLAATATPSPTTLPGQSWSVQTADGLVVVTHIGGCGCTSPLRSWRPVFSTQVTQWPERITA